MQEGPKSQPIQRYWEFQTEHFPEYFLVEYKAI
jgi:hypothetical protein